ncbi:MAG: hypothetical protein ACI31F_00410 [Muribaculaceae bacterium]
MNSNANNIAKCNADSTVLTAVSFVLLLATIVFSYYLRKYGLNLADESYQALNSLDYKTSPLAPLTAIWDNLTNTICGYNLLNMRYITWTYNILAILLAGTFLYCKTKRKNLTIVTCAAIVLFSAIDEQFSLIGWDRQTTLLLTIITIQLLTLGKHKIITEILFLAVTSAILILCRAPNVAVMPVAAVVLLFQKRYPIKLRIMFAALYTATVIVIVYLAIIMMYGSISSYIGYIKSNIPSDHSFHTLFRCFLGNCYNASSTIYMTFLSCIISITFIRKTWAKIVFFIVAVLLIDHYNSISGTTVYWFAILFFAELSSVYSLWREKEYAAMGNVTLLIMLSFVPIAGSNVGFTKYFIFPAIPLLLALYPCKISSGYKLGLSTAIVPFVWSTLVGAYFHTFQDKGYPDLSVKMDIEPVSGIYTTPERAEYVNTIVQVAEEYAREDIIVIAPRFCRYFFEWKFAYKNDFLRHNWDENDFFNDEEYVKHIAEKIASQKGVSVLYIYRGEGAYFRKEQVFDTKMSQLLCNSLSLQYKNEYFAIFTK